jgi:hypothetical protein
VTTPDRSDPPGACAMGGTVFAAAMMVMIAVDVFIVWALARVVRAPRPI